ncbi:MAG: GNAT family N-acetyltransferase, partial [Sphingomonadaceae bacterium]|nr:GNAT family N-acetyltransferase [Sphingomonadaceae bacterium]
GQGVARTLLGEAARRAEAMGGSYLRLSVDAANQAARDFYSAQGFRDAADERMMVLEGDAFAAMRENER